MHTPGTILVDTDFARRYGVQNPTKLRVIRTVEDERVEVEWDEFGETLTDVVYTAESSAVPDPASVSTWDLVVALLGRPD